MIVNYADTEYQVSDEFSFKDFTGVDPVVVPNGAIVYCSCFAHEKPDAEVFPSDLSGATFINCNLDNVKIPDGNTVIGCSQRRIMTLDDGLDWLVDEKGNPIEPLNGYPPDQPQISDEEIQIVEDVLGRFGGDLGRLQSAVSDAAAVRVTSSVGVGIK